MLITKFAEMICSFLKEFPEVKSCKLYGSLCNESFDEYSDIDIEIDVTGTDNSQFVTKIPEMLSKKFPVIFYDYAPSLVPEKYVVSVAIDERNPFMLIDIACTANPHCLSISKQYIGELNNKYDHTLKLFSANLKHYLRGTDCYNDIEKMYKRIFSMASSTYDEKQMLNAVYEWIKENAEGRHQAYIDSLEGYI